MQNWIGRALVIASVAAGAASAHDFWIQPSSFWITPGADTSLAILVGHGPARQHWVLRLNRVVALNSFGPGGSRASHIDALRQGTYAPDARIGFGAAGTYVVAFENTPSVNNLPADRFTDYLRAEGIRPALAWRQRTGTTGLPGRESYSRRAKALMQVGRSTRAQPQVTRPIGLTLEIVPEISPYTAGPSTMLPVRVYYEGHLLPGAFVKLTNLSDDEKPLETHVTDRGGRAVFQLRRSGEWQMNVVWSKPVEGNPDVEFETVFSSLTFGFPGGAVAR